MAGVAGDERAEQVTHSVLLPFLGGDIEVD